MKSLPVLLLLQVAATGLFAAPAFAEGAGARMGDRTSGGAVITSGSPNVFIEGVRAARRDDVAQGGIAAQMNGGSYYGKIIEGSYSVFINGRSAARVNDRVYQGAVGTRIIEGGSSVQIQN